MTKFFDAVIKELAAAVGNRSKNLIEIKLEQQKIMTAAWKITGEIVNISLFFSNIIPAARQLAQHAAILPERWQGRTQAGAAAMRMEGLCGKMGTIMPVSLRRDLTIFSKSIKIYDNVTNIIMLQAGRCAAGPRRSEERMKRHETIRNQPCLAGIRGDVPAIPLLPAAFLPDDATGMGRGRTRI